MNNYILVTQPVYADIHSNLVTIPLKTKYALPYGLMYANEPTSASRKFINAIKEIKQRKCIPFHSTTFTIHDSVQLLSFNLYSSLPLMHGLLCDFYPSDQRFALGLVGSPHPAFFRFKVTLDTLAFGCILPTTWQIRDFRPLETCAAWRTKNPASLILFNETCRISYFITIRIRSHLMSFSNVPKPSFLHSRYSMQKH